ncbi:hypothetical protein CAPTEDRAFT_183389 [Capitella teleta]|uniref:Katanin p60 ATPase-containing subunit A-like 2 n=1 Tax=Capitella teleta TaxID=283909 RepID=R7U5C0_CAPTE|nr:hypothetical protein CAPTEDRAFT_183389 [Capitella teleta]|eukprot:ELU01316.1 hypothetical protein CAPTEDRAFT_183389 [Capitella teleta]
MSETLSYQSIRSANVAREADAERTDIRKKNLLILVLSYLHEEGYVESAQSLSKETNIDLRKFEVCDNVDLETVLMEYESYYFIKFSKYPKITKKLTPAGELLSVGVANAYSRRDSRCSSTPSLPRIPPSTTTGGATNGRPRSAKKTTNGKKVRPLSPSLYTLSILFQSGANGHVTEGVDLSLHGMNPGAGPHASSAEGDQAPRRKERLLKPLGGYVGYSSEWRDLAQVISRDIYSENPDVRWDDIIGLESAKRLVKEAVVYPIRYPQLFTGILSPWKGLLLFGPPGTGKTLLAKAVATECGTTFFNISASSIVSKWRGDSEKLVRVLFEMARFHAPSTIFLDELESLMSQRGSGGGGGGEHEGSRRMKTELLVQMDGLSKSDELVFLLAASNLPWELDHAMLRRLEKRILVGLPTPPARAAMLQHHLPPRVCTKDNGLELTADLDYDYIAEKTEGYSGSDIRLLCKEAAMGPVRKIFTALETHAEGTDLHVKLDTITTMDVESALKHTKPSARNLVVKYEAWQKEYESV